MVSTASSGKLTWSTVLSQILSGLPKGSSITSATLTSLSGGQPRGSATVYGTVALTGNTATMHQVASILRALAASPDLTDVYLTSTSAGSTTTTAEITWTISADITSKALATTTTGTTP